ncbi:MAG: carbohydrate binding domain-containing protein, partial [Thermoproteota archaeon]
YARQLLTHLNPYTGMTYVEDPAIAFIEIVNEQGLLHSWLGGVIDRLPEVFRNRLQEKWNSYLASKYSSDEEFRQAWNGGTGLVGAELLKNSCFENGVENWVVEVHDGALASSRIVDGPDGKMALEIRVERLGLESWHVQFNQPGLRIVEGENYLVRFSAKADRAVSVSVGLVQAHEPWRLVSPRVQISLSTEWNDYEIALVASESEDNARLDASGLGANIAVYQFSCFSMKRFKGYGSMEGESVENGMVRILTLMEYGKRSEVAKRDWINFLYDAEERFFTEMRRFIKEELNAKALVIGTVVGCSTPNIMSKLDIVDTHAYWCHPSFPGMPWDSSNWYVVNEPMVNNPRQSTIVGLAVKRVENKPHFVTEYNHPSPNMYDAETVLTLATYASIQDWDGVFLFDYGSRGDWDARRLRGFFNIDQHPVKMATLIPAYFIFLRGDVKPAEKLVTIGLSREDEANLIGSGRIYAWALPDASHVGLNPLLSLVHRVAIATNVSQAGEDMEDEVLGPVYCSDNGEVIWDVSDQGRGRILVNTSRSIAIIGFNEGGRLNFSNIAIEIGETLLNGWSVITITAIDGENMTSCSRMLLIATGYTTNTGMLLSTYEGGERMLKWSGRTLAGVKIYNEPVTCGTNWGTSPTLAEGIPATISIRTGMRLQVWALDNIGRRVKQVNVVDEGEYKIFSIGPEFQTLWYELEFSPT